MALTDKIVEFNLTEKDLARFNNANVPFEEIYPYLEDFYYPTFWERLLRRLNLRKVPLRNRETDADSLLTLFNHGVPPTLAGRYYVRFNADEISSFYEKGFPLSLAVSYPERFSAEEIEVLGRNLCPPNIVESYHPRFCGGEVAYMIGRGCTPEVANQFSHDFNGIEIAIILIQNTISGRSGELMKSLCPENIAARGHFSFSDMEYTLLSIWGVPSAEIPAKKQKELGEVMRTALVKMSIWGLEDQARKPAIRSKLNEIISQLVNVPDGLVLVSDPYPPEHFSKKIESEITKELVVDAKEMLQRYNFLGIGAYSLVVFDNHLSSAYKFSRTGKKEAELLYQLSALPIQENTIRIKKAIEFGKVDIIELQYIPGTSLHQFLCEKIKLSPEKTVNYSSGILNGLLELRQAGIWHHRDIRPANIMIDKEKDRAVIIDLGIATTDKNALAEDNRRFGSPSSRRANDLTSLGQVVYKMATGEHIFAESKSMERTTYADKLRDQRDWIYEDPKERLKPHLHTVSKRIESVTIRNIINFCLTAQGTDEEYQQLEQMFGEYVT